MSFQPARYDVTFLRRHALHEIRDKAFEFEHAFNSYIAAPVQVTNLLPGAPHNAPRFQMHDGKRTLAVTGSAVQLTLEFGTGLPQRSWPDLLSKPASLMDSTDKYFPPHIDAFKAVIIQISRPFRGSQDDVTKHIGQLFSQTPAGDGTAAGYTYGVMSEGIITMFEISQYKFFEVTAVGSTPAAALSNLDIEFLAPTDQGMQFKVEASTRANLSAASATSFSELVRKVDDALRDPISVKMLGT